MSLVIDATVGSAQANSYNDLAGLELLAAESWPYPEAWGRLDPDTQSRIAVSVTRWMETLRVPGHRTHIVQSLLWPRTGVSRDGVCLASDAIPGPVLRAHARACFFLAECHEAVVDPWVTAQDTGLTGIDLGDELRMTFAAAATSKRPPMSEFYSAVLSPLLGSLAWVGQAEALR